MSSRIATALTLAALALLRAPALAEDQARPRLLVLTDISSLTAGVAEPDDGQSLIRLLLYSNDIEIEGLVATSNMQHGRRTRPDLIRQAVDAYERVRPNLARHDPRYPPAEVLRAGIRAGQSHAGPDVPVAESIGDDKDTEASAWIVACADRPDPGPLCITIWGGSTDLAQALWRVRRDRSPEELGRFLARLRVHAIGDQDATCPWIREQFPNLDMITQRRAYRGMYRGGDASLVSSEWVERHIHGHGALGDLYPNYRGGDIWSRTLGPVRGIKEGDTPSFLALVPNGLTDPAHPELGSWGGRFEGTAAQRTDVADTDLDTSADPDPRMSSVYRWRSDFQADFAARLDWCVQPFDRANHAPVVRIAGPSARRAISQSTVTLDASGSRDPDGDRLTYAWTLYPPDPALASHVKLHDSDGPVVRVEIGDVPMGRTIPVLLTVRDDGSPRLARYGRVLVEVAGDDPRPAP